MEKVTYKLVMKHSDHFEVWNPAKSIHKIPTGTDLSRTPERIGRLKRAGDTPQASSRTGPRYERHSV